MANRLIHEQSPYLQQHAHNPVDWYPWGDEAFERAAKEQKPVLVSIGYSACHWCHVMERESFENAAVAAYMNEHFINIKVDREEHPDVDHMYMDAVQAISGSGGWPLNVFVTPERLPFYGGTYYPPRPAFNRPSWMGLLERMNDIWAHRRDEVEAQGTQMLQYLQQASKVASGAQGQQADTDTCKVMAGNLLQQADKVHGGFGNAPKFPGTMAISYLLEHYHYTGNKEALAQAQLSLDAMISGGIYDQLGGGFARYATDNEWLIPHFEKMLYDNALLVSSLCDAYMLTGEERYRRAITETIAFVERELKDPSGLYYSALDADSEGVEGKFYTWTWAEWQEVVSDDPVMTTHFGVSEAGNWEHTNILHIVKSEEEIAIEKGLDLVDVRKHIGGIKEKLFEARNKRIRPLTDDKSLLSWNALMNIALSKVYLALDEEKYLVIVREHMRSMLQNFVQAGALLHTWKQGTARIAAKLDDYAYLIQALLQLAEVSGDNEFISSAIEWTERVVNEFGHEDGNYFYYSSALQTDIPVRKTDLYDGALPSANAVMAHNLLVLGMCAERSDWSERASYMLQQVTTTCTRYTYSFAYWAMLLQRMVKGVKTVVCTGEEAHKMALQVLKRYVPHGYIVTSEKEIFDLPLLRDKYISGKSLIFVCRQDACLSPVSDIKAALHIINQ
jgi:uncharacterized protein YyaL (SSP411 family)